MSVKHKDQQTVSTLWIVVTALSGILIGVLSSFVNLQPQVNTLKAQGSHMQSVIQEQNRQIASMRNQGLVYDTTNAGSRTTTNAGAGPLGGQASQAAAANKQMTDLSAAQSMQNTTSIASPASNPATQMAHEAPSRAAVVEQTPAPAPALKEPQPPKSTADLKPAQAPLVEQRKTSTDKPADKPKSSGHTSKADQPITKEKSGKPDTPKPSTAVNTPPPVVKMNVNDGLHPDAAKAVEQRDPEHRAESKQQPLQTPPIAIEAEPKLSKAVVKATLAQANIVGMDGVSVTFKTGLRVQVGSQFPSGERLISVEPASKRIETDRRTILLQIDEKSN